MEAWKPTGLVGPEQTLNECGGVNESATPSLQAKIEVTGFPLSAIWNGRRLGE